MRNSSAALALLAMSCCFSVRAEMIEEIMAQVNGDIITRSEYDEEQKGRIAEVQRQYKGEELDRELKSAKEQLLLQLIDRKILLHQAKALGYDLDRMSDTFYELFKEQSNVKSDAEFERMLQEDGLTVQEVKRKLVELRAPEEVIRFQVSSRIAVGDAEVAAYYAEHPDQFRVAGKVTLREIVLLADGADNKKLRRAEVDEIRQRLVDGEDFGAVAREVSEAGTRDTGGLLGPLERSDISPILEKSAFTLPPGQISEVMETPYGFHLVKVESRMDEHLTPLADVQEKLRRYLEDRKFKNALASFLEKARAEAEWCVKPKYQELLPTPAPASCGAS